MGGKKCPWKDFESWKRYGVEKGFEKYHPTKLGKSENEEERRWYKKGEHEKWNKGFLFSRKKVEGIFDSCKDWKEHGLSHGYDLRTPSSLENSSDQIERAWYSKGYRYKWLADFSMNRKPNHGGQFASFEEWQKFGIEQGFDQRNSTGLQESFDSQERAWYCRGSNQRWLKRFKFKFKRNKDGFGSLEEWMSWGMEHDLENRSPTSIAYSGKKEERAWYKYGSRRRWIDNFEFSREIRRFIRSRERFLEFIKENPMVQNVIALANNLPCERLTFEAILMEVYEDRFENIAALSNLVDTSIGGVFSSLKGQIPKLTAYMGEFDEDRDFVGTLEAVATQVYEIKQSPSIDERFYRLFKIAYGPTFNRQPTRTLDRLEHKAKEYNRKAKSLYQRLLDHYQETYILQGQIEATSNH